MGESSGRRSGLLAPTLLLLILSVGGFFAHRLARAVSDLLAIGVSVLGIAAIVVAIRWFVRSSRDQ